MFHYYFPLRSTYILFILVCKFGKQEVKGQLSPYTVGLPRSITVSKKHMTTKDGNLVFVAAFDVVILNGISSSLFYL